jgi:hypothetical protein
VTIRIVFIMLSFENLKQLLRALLLDRFSLLPYRLTKGYIPCGPIVLGSDKTVSISRSVFWTMISQKRSFLLLSKLILSCLLLILGLVDLSGSVFLKGR